MADERYQLATAQSYWRHAPSGEGKHDTSTLAAVSDETLLSAWDAAFRSRFRGYPEEDVFIRVFSRSVAARRILSVGSGLGFHEIFYQSRGAQLTCADIVPTNLEVITRVAALKGLAGIRTLALDDRSRGFPDLFDTVFIYGSLMHMPRDNQRTLLAHAAAALEQDGRIVLMVYTWEFVRRTCGWRTPEEFDPIVFARASDPTVGSEDCPWSDWYDDARLLELVAPDFCITRAQNWNGGLYVWYELRRGLRDAPPLPFFDDRERYNGRVVRRVPGTDFVAGDAADREAPDGRHFVTSANRFNYAAISAMLQVSDAGAPNAVDVAIELERGSVSVGVLDTQRNVFVANTVVTATGPCRARLLAPAFPDEYQIVVSNHHPDLPGESAFVVRWAEIVISELVEPPSGVLPDPAQ